MRTIVVGLLLALPLQASSQNETCQQIQREIDRLQSTLADEQQALASCTNHLGTCTPGQTAGLQQAIRTAQEELADARVRLRTCGPVTRPPPRPSAFALTDVSPDAPFGGASNGGSEPSGRILTVVVDPHQASTLYAASEFAGVWKSTDGAHTWKQASSGLAMSELWTPRSFDTDAIGATIGETPVLAIDETDPGHLALASGHDDFRPTHTAAGVWVSLDGAATWRRRAIVGAGCTNATAYRVAFAGGHGYAITSCGLATSSGDLASWTVGRTPFTVSPRTTFLAARGQQLFVCDGTTVRTAAWSRGGGLAWGATATLPGTCRALAAPPSKTPTVLAAHDRGTQLDITSVELGAPPTVVSTAFTQSNRGSGVVGVFVAPRPRDGGDRYDVFAADGNQFFQYLPRTSDFPGRWQVVAGVHADTWSMAFPSTYDPTGGNCTAYTASDGGIHTSLASSPGKRCLTVTGPWARGVSGLHVFGGTSIVGVPQAPCGTPRHPCPALYLSGPDNATWMSATGGVPGAGWSAMPCCGDSGSASVDWAAPSLVVISRNGFRRQFRGTGGAPPTASSPTIDLIANSDSSWVERSEPPQQATFAQLITRTAEARARPLPTAITSGDYFQVRTVTVGRTTDETVFRRSDGASWVDIAPGNHFASGTLSAIAVGGGHQNPTVYALTNPTSSAARTGVLQRRSASDPRTTPWQSAMGAATDAARVQDVADVWVNPDDPLQVYITDVGAGVIKYSFDGGQHWRNEPELTRIASHGGEYRVGCFDPLNIGRRFCSVQQVLFVRDRSQLRVALTFPGGVAISRDSGEHWREIDSVSTNSLGIQSLHELIAHPYAAFLDAAADDSFSLYLALRGGPLVRIDGRF